MATTDIAGSLDTTFFQTDIGVFITKMVDAAIIISSLICLGYLLWGGLDWLLSGGDKQKYEAARDKMMHAAIGLALIVAVFAVWKLILYFFGLSQVIQTK
jgi:hypothetical protein